MKRNGVLQGNVKEMAQSQLKVVFMLHRLGHFLGLNAHDTSGYEEGIERINILGLKSLWKVRILEEGMVITIESRCYFIEALLVPAIEDFAKSNFFVKSKLKPYSHSNGVRLEDDILVIANGCENLSICLLEIEDVEVVMK